MLEFMRKSANTIFIKLFLGLLILSFAAWGIGDIFRGRASNVVVATVGDSEIPIEAFRAEFASELNRMSQIFGQTVSREQGLAMGLGNIIASRLAQQELIHEGARDLGLMITDAMVVEEIKKSDEFKNDAGRFDRNIYLNTLSRAGLTENRYVSLVRFNALRQQYLIPLATGVEAPKAMVDMLYAHAQEKRSVELVRINHAAIQNVPSPSDDELAAFHKENSANFMAPEYRDITAVVLQAEKIAQNIEISEDELQAAYDERASEYMTPEKRRLRQILVNDEATAKKAHEMLTSGKSLEEVAVTVGANAAMIDIGEFTSADAANLSADISTAVFALPLGGYSEPLHSPLGWHVFTVTNKTPGEVKTLDQVRDELTKAVKMDRAVNALYDLSNELDDMIGGGKTFEEAAAALNVEAVSLSAVDTNGLTPQGVPAKAPYLDSLVKKAFELSEGQDSQMSEAGNGKAFFVVRVNGVTPPALRPLDTVKTEVAQAWDRQKRSEMAAEIVKTVEARLKAGEDAKAVAQSLGFTASTTQPFTRDGKGLQQNALPADVLPTIFGLNVNEVASAEGTGAHTVARLTNISKAEIDANSPAYKAVQSDTLTAVQNDLMTQMSIALETVHGVTLNPAAIQNAF